MFKVPAPGASKTRLTPPLTPMEAATLSRSFVADVASTVAELAGSCGADAVAIYTPADRRGDLADLLPEGFAYLEQRGDDLTQRLQHAAHDLFRIGYTGVCFLGADSPTLPASLLQETLDLLREPGERAVIGPAIDGGYCLIGFNSLQPRLFEDISWSTSQVLAQSIVRALDLSLDLTVLPPWYDVDDIHSLRLLMYELLEQKAPLAGVALRGSPAPHSRAFLDHLLQQPGASRLQSLISAQSQPGA